MVLTKQYICRPNHFYNILKPNAEGISTCELPILFLLDKNLVYVMIKGKEKKTLI